MSANIVTGAARLGHLFSHASEFEDAEGATMLGTILGDKLASLGNGGSIAAAIGEGLASSSEHSDATVIIRAVTANAAHGEVVNVSDNTFLSPELMGAALSDYKKESCERHSDKPLKTGALAVFVNGRRLARAGDLTGCGAELFEGEATVLVGGPPSEEPPDVAKLSIEEQLSGSCLGEIGGAVASAVVGQAMSLLHSGAHPSEWGAALAKTAKTEAASALKDELSSTADHGCVLGELLSTDIGGAVGSWIAGKL